MPSIPHIIATESAGNSDVLTTLGIDVKLLIFQIIGFAILAWVLAKFVFPVFMRAVDERQRIIETGLKEAAEAHEALENAEMKADDVLTEARKEARALLQRSQEEAANVLLAAEERAKARADQIVADARTTLAVDVRKARETLKKDTISLVALATERIIGEKVDANKDSELIARALAKETK
jgi:F-type H+-transporting ATPase subunit b